MMDVYSTSLEYIQIAGIGAVQYLFAVFAAGKRPDLRSALAYAGLLATAAAASRILPVGAASVLLQLLILYAVTHFLMRVPNGEAWAASILAVAVTWLSIGIGNSISTLVLSTLIATPVFDTGRAITLGATLGICAGASCLALRLMPPGGLEKSFVGLLLVPLLFFCGAELFVIETAYTVASIPLTTEETAGHTTLLLLQILGLAALFCTLAAYRYVSHTMQVNADLEILNEALSAQRTYVHEAQKRYERTRELRHDLKNHLAILNGLLASCQTEEARAYLERLEAASQGTFLPSYTGRPPVDILLAEKIASARNAGIDVRISAPLPRTSVLDDFDLCVLFANALDNAAAACSRTDESRQITVDTARQGDFLLIRVDNSCPDEPIGEEGTGTHNMRTVASKYAGTLERTSLGGTFSLQILLDISGCADHSS